MARGRHRRRSGLLSRLLPRRGGSVSRVSPGAAELARLRVLSDVTAAAASAAVVRAAAAAEQAAVAGLRADRAERALASASRELVAVRAELAALREELVWAFAEGKVPAPKVVDLRDATARTA